MSTTAQQHNVADLPPSAKFVLKILEYEGGTLTQQQIAEKTMLPTRTVRHATRQLREEGIIDERFSFRDARKKLYSLETMDD